MGDHVAMAGERDFAVHRHPTAYAYVTSRQQKSIHVSQQQKGNKKKQLKVLLENWKMDE